MNIGIYEELITQIVSDRLKEIRTEDFYINEVAIDKEEASLVLSRHLANTFKFAFSLLAGEEQVNKKIEIANKVILFLKEEVANVEIEENLIQTPGRLLKAIFSKVDSPIKDFELKLKEITPYTRLSYSELFTGGINSLSVGSEVKKEILSSDRIDLLVAFIKFNGLTILEKELIEFTNRGGQLRIITTTYTGATEYRAVERLARLKNTQIKISYDNSRDRLHAKSYMFSRNSGFHTAYVGSSNISRPALTDGLEWNLKITTREIGHVIDKLQKTFETYWNSEDFELFNESIHREKLVGALKQGQGAKFNFNIGAFFDIKPYPYQSEILEKLEVERVVHGRTRNLLVAATGTGKTIISAFDYKRFRTESKSSRLLFLAHRQEILVQSISTFQGVLKDNNFGELWVDGLVPTNYEFVFASIQTVNNSLGKLELSPQFYDFIIIDECHHIAANSYRKIIEYFQPKILLGLTATPERMDGSDILIDFCDKIGAEIRLPEALNRKLLCPFQYFGVSDSVDLSNVEWSNGKYSTSELTKLYTSSDRRVQEVIDNLEKYTRDINDVVCLGFCVSVDHAAYMAKKFTLAGFKADYLTSVNSDNRREIRNRLTKKEINYLFVVDIFNEGIDIPEIDTVLFLRPTESLTVFVQQLGRGLRMIDGKDSLTVLDFVGNARPEYNFESRFRALIGKTNTTVQKEIEENFPHLPLGCSIVLEKKAKESILANITASVNLNQKQIIQKLRNFEFDTDLPLNLKNFLKFYDLDIRAIYKNVSWKRLCTLAKRHEEFSDLNEKALVSAVSNKWFSTKSQSYFSFILKLARQSFDVNFNEFTENEKQMLLMLHYDFWKNGTSFESLEHSIKEIGKNRILVDEIVEILELLLDEVDFKEIDIDLPYTQPLKLHARYTRDQILAAFQFSSFHKKSSIREGVAESSKLNTELLFVNLKKSDEDFSPTTMYDDYALSEILFHWQSQNSARPDSGKGLSYVQQKSNRKIILLFIRESKRDQFGNTLGYVFIGKGVMKTHSGSKPMNIIWELNEPIPHYMWNASAKLAAG